MESDTTEYPCTAGDGYCTCDDCRQDQYEAHREMMALATWETS